MPRYALILLALLFASASALAKAPDCEPFGDGEKTVFSLTYLGVTAGTAEFTSLRAPGGWRLATLTKTDPVFSLFYRVEDRYETLTDAREFRPVRMTATIDESRQTGIRKQEFDHKNLFVRILDDRHDQKKGPIQKDERKPISTLTRDIVSALFSVRREPLRLGKELQVELLLGDEIYRVRFDVEGEEVLPTKLGPIPAWVLRASVLKNGTYQELPESQLWLEKEEARRILKVRAKTKVGSIIAYLKSFESGTHSQDCTPRDALAVL